MRLRRCTKTRLERAGIPFVTIAGRGFYDRPEIRDVLNALAAIHDPTDDLALAGLLRSPAIGLSDADLYRLRFADGSDQPRALWETLKPVRFRHTFAAHEVLRKTSQVSFTELHDLAGRVSVAEVLKRFLDLTHYRALLSAVPQGHRLRRNVDQAAGRRARQPPDQPGRISGIRADTGRYRCARR